MYIHDIIFIIKVINKIILFNDLKVIKIITEGRAIATKNKLKNNIFIYNLLESN